jgi:hypothetical protein
MDQISFIAFALIPDIKNQPYNQNDSYHHYKNIVGYAAALHKP